MYNFMYINCTMYMNVHEFIELFIQNLADNLVGCTIVHIQYEFVHRAIADYVELYMNKEEEYEYSVPVGTMGTLGTGTSRVSTFLYFSIKGTYICNFQFTPLIKLSARCTIGPFTFFLNTYWEFCSFPLLLGCINP